MDGRFLHFRHPQARIGGWKRGGLILADNALGSSSWWIDDTGNPSRRGADELTRLVAGDPEFEAVAVPVRQGLLIGRRM